MILGFALGMPVVAAVPVRDRWNLCIQCPYCDHIHQHFAEGPTAPMGASDGGRYAHCGTSDPRSDAGDGAAFLQDAGVLPKMYVLKEVPGWADLAENGEETRIFFALTYDYGRINYMQTEIAETIRIYEAKWGPESPDAPGREAGYRYCAAATAGRPRIPVADVLLYRWYDGAGRLLYIGITGDLLTRQASHSRKSSWVQFAAGSTIERHPTREAALASEERAIKLELPLFNKQHNDTPEARRRLVEYLIERGRLDLLAPAVSRG